MAVFEDRLSPLPDGLLLHILSLTKSYKAAVVCSVLSKRWRTLYTQLPRLTLKSGDILGNKRFRFVLMGKFRKIVTRALLVHRKDLETLSLHTFLAELQGTPDSIEDPLKDWPENAVEPFEDPLNDWLENAADRNVQNLSLFNLTAMEEPMEEDIYRCNIPNHLFSCTSLVILHLSGFTFFNLHSCRMFFTGFPHLKSCTMEACEIHDLTTFLDNCPVLHTLKLLECDADSDFTISSKSLLVLNIAIIPRHHKITVECPKLRHIYFDCDGLLQCEQLSSLGPLLSSLYHAQLSENGDLISVVFDSSDPSCSDASYMPAMIRTRTFSTLQAMELRRVETYPTSIWMAISHLPLFCTLHLSDCIFLGNKNEKSEISDNIQLREAHVKLRNTSPGEMQMIFLLTQKCPMLHNLFLTLQESWMRNNDAGYLKILTELLSNQSPGQHLQLKQFRSQSQIKITKQP